MRKITVDNSVRYVPKSEKPPEKDIKPRTTKAGSLPCKQNKNISRNSKKFVKDFAGCGFAIPK